MNKDEWRAMPDKERQTYRISGVRHPARVVYVHKDAACMEYHYAGADGADNSERTYCPCEMLRLWSDDCVEPSKKKTETNKTPKPEGHCLREVPRTFKCEFCGVKVLVTERGDSRVKYCSDECKKNAKALRAKEKAEEKRKHVAARKLPMTFKCQFCGCSVIVTDRQDRRSKFCSEECQTRANRRKAAEERARQREATEKALKELSS